MRHPEIEKHEECHICGVMQFRGEIGKIFKFKFQQIDNFSVSLIRLLERVISRIHVGEPGRLEVGTARQAAPLPSILLLGHGHW